MGLVPKIPIDLEPLDLNYNHLFTTNLNYGAPTI